MKGTIIKTEQGWVVQYGVINSIRSLPLHPEFIEMMDTCFTSKFTKEVEFEIVTEWENGEVGVNGLTYAKLINQSVDTNEMINQVPDVGKMVSNGEIGKKRWDDWNEFNKKACYPEEHQSAFADGFTRGAKWVNEIAKETLFSEEQVRKAISMTRDGVLGADEIIQSLKQPKQ